MDVTRSYAIVAQSLFAVLTTVNFCILLCTILQTYTVWILQQIVYPFFLGRHRLVGPWSLRGFILRCIYVLTNIFYSAYGTESIMEAGKRIGILSLINLMPLYFGPHLDFLAEFLGVSLHDLHTVHGSAATMSVLLSAAHALFSVFGGQWNALAWLPRPCALFVRLIHRSCRVVLRTIRPSRHSPCYSLLSRSAFVDRPTSFFCEPIELGRCSVLVPCGHMLRTNWRFRACAYTFHVGSLL